MRRNYRFLLFHTKADLYRLKTAESNEALARLILLSLMMRKMIFKESFTTMIDKRKKKEHISFHKKKINNNKEK